MRFLTFLRNGVECVGLLDGDRVVDLSAAAPALPSTLLGLVEGDHLEAAGRAAAAAPDTARFALADIRYRPLLPMPPKMVNLIAASPEAAAQWDVTGAVAMAGGWPVRPGLTIALHTRLTAHQSPMMIPRRFKQLDYGVALAVVLKRGGRDIAAGAAADHIAGYAVLNGGVLRDVPAGQTLAVAHNGDRTAPFGPELVTPDALPLLARGLRMTLKRSGVTVQDGSTDDTWPVDEAIARVSRLMTLEAGDVLTMGTLPGAIHEQGEAAEYLRDGEVLEAWIEGVGTLVNRIEQTV